MMDFSLCMGNGQGGDLEEGSEVCFMEGFAEIRCGQFLKCMRTSQIGSRARQITYAA